MTQKEIELIERFIELKIIQAEDIKIGAIGAIKTINKEQRKEIKQELLTK